MRRNTKRGFTLVELVTVLAVLAVLAAIVVPTGFGAVDKGEASVCNKTIAAVLKGYEVRYTMKPDDTKNACIDYAVRQTGGVVGVSGVTYTGLCPSGGTYTLTINDEGAPVMRCSEATHTGGKSQWPLHSAPGQFEYATRLLEELRKKDPNFNNLTPDKQVRAAMDLVLASNNGKPYQLTDTEKTYTKSLENKNDYTWRVVLNKSGELMVIASNKQTDLNGGNAFTPLIYYKGTYYKWVKPSYSKPGEYIDDARYVTDISFDPEALTNWEHAQNAGADGANQGHWAAVAHS